MYKTYKRRTQTFIKNIKCIHDVGSIEKEIFLTFIVSKKLSTKDVQAINIKTWLNCERNMQNLV